MARAALELGVRELADAAKVSTNTITRLERGDPLKERTVDAIRRALEEAGVIFVAENGEGPGVRLRKNLNQSGGRRMRGYSAVLMSEDGSKDFGPIDIPNAKFDGDALRNAGAKLQESGIVRGIVRISEDGRITDHRVNVGFSDEGLRPDELNASNDD